MKPDAKSRITPPAEELKLALSNREQLREAYCQASLVTRGSLARELKELDALTSEGLEEL